MRYFVAVAFLFSFHTSAFSAESTDGNTSLKIREAIGNKKFEEDKRITDIELKAQAGSLSRYSLKFDLSYSGPPVDNLSDPQMPNPDNRTRPNRTSLAGYTGLRYRVNSQEAWNVSTGLKWYSPYQQVAGEETEKRTGEKDYEFVDPRLAYDWTYPFYGTQMRTSVKGSVTTADFYQERGQTGSVGFNQSFKYSVPQTRLILGTALDTDFYFFDRGYRSKDGRVSNYFLTLIPSLEYKLLDKLNVKTSVAYSLANLRLANDWRTWEEFNPTARAGLGWAVTRTIYFNPYLNFFLERPAIRTTSLSFSTVFSIF